MRGVRATAEGSSNVEGLHLERILVAADLQAPSEAAVSYAHLLARHFGASMRVLHVVDMPAPEGQASDASTDEKREERLHAASDELRAFVERLLPSPLGTSPRSEIVVMLGRPANAILEVAAAQGADLLVLGSHGRGAVGRWVLGSVATEVLRHALIPVLVLRAPAPFVGGGTVLVAVDFSEASEAAARYAGCLAADAKASLDLLHVLPVPAHHSSGHAAMQEVARKALEALQARAVLPTVTCQRHVLMAMGDTARAVIDHATSEGADLIVMGGHGVSGWTHGLLGSVTERVLHGTSLPLLVVRPPRRVRIAALSDKP